MVLPDINMHPPLVYTCSPSWTPHPPPSLYHPSGSSQCTSPKHPVSCIEPGLVIHFLYDIIHALGTLTLACSWAKSSKAYFTIRCWIVHVTYWTLYWKWKRESLCRYRMVESVSIVYPHNGITDWERRLLPLPSIRRVLHCISLVWGKLKIWCTVSTQYILLSYPCKVKKS